METNVIYPANISGLGKLGVDLYFNKVENFSKDDMEKAFRSEICNLIGAKPGDRNWMYKFKENQYKVFSLIAETITTILPVTIDQELNAFAEIRNTNWGDQLRFEVTDPKLFAVARISAGNDNLRSQRLGNGKLTLQTEYRGVKIYEEFERWAAGRIDWAKMVDRVSRSFLNQIRTDIYNAIYDSYSDLNSTYGITGTFDTQKFVELAQHIEAGTGDMKPYVFGTKLALSKVMNDQYYYNGDLTKQLNEKGYLPNYNGYPLVEIKQSHKPNTDTFAIDNNFLLFIPAGVEKIVKIGFEGQAIVDQANTQDNADDSIEYMFKQKYGVAVLSAGKYGIWKNLA